MLAGRRSTISFKVTLPEEGTNESQRWLALVVDDGAGDPASSAPELVAAAIRALLLAPIDAQALTRKRCVVASRDLLSFESILPAYCRIYRPDIGASELTIPLPAEAPRA